jgi:energy-coupling factor transporter transmembrane protein EcfT
MRTSWHDIWGCASGPATRLAPQVRLTAGAAAFTACMVAPAATAPGALVIACAAASWLLACRPPGRVVGASLLLGLGMFLPFFLLTPLIEAGPPGEPRSWMGALAVVWGVFARGMSGILVSTATIASLSASDLREGLIRLPGPGMVTAILVQIVHQAATLAYETRRVAMAMEVRGASSGAVAAWRVLSSLPKVWLPRIFERAERVAAAMELRGYCEGGLRSFRPSPVRPADGMVLAAALGVLALAAASRWLDVS